MPRPAPRVAPATSATRPLSGFAAGRFLSFVVVIVVNPDGCGKTKRVFRLRQTAAMSPRRRKAEDVDVFGALVRVMLRRGPAELTLREIAAEAGVTAGALVQRFGSKRALLLAQARHAAATGNMGVTAPRPRTTSPLGAIHAMTAVYAE